ncbi:hypothetical protein WJX73_006429 [Symbiochloris irregularis]|uniref:Repressor of RNA polymerase III transcription n=1 Tax=Symbiochloris irregularis TaxID=706552 RepID=A0AAW1P9U7_9CHLO
MKFLEHSSLLRVKAFLDHLDVGDYIVSGELEAYSCKLAGLDKKLSKSLDTELGSSPEMSKSPVGPLVESSSRKTLIYLILTLNQIYPDYDFSQLRAHHFRKEPGLATAEEAIDSHLLEVSRKWESAPNRGEASFLDTLWKSLDEAVELPGCDVYTYKSDGDTDPFGEKGNIWAFNYFFYNKKQKKIAYFSCRAISRTVAHEDSKTSSGRYASYASAADNSDDGDSRYGMAGAMDV